VAPGNSATVVAITTLAGWGVGGIIAPISTVALSATPDTFLATVISLLNAVKFIGGSIGYSIYYAIFSAKLKKKLPTLLAGAIVQAGLPLTSVPGFIGTFLTDPTQLATVPGVTPQVIGAAAAASKIAYAESLRFVWYTTIPFGVMTTIAVLVMGNTRKYQTNRVAAVSESRSNSHGSLLILNRLWSKHSANHQDSNMDPTCSGLLSLLAASPREYSSMVIFAAIGTVLKGLLCSNDCLMSFRPVYVGLLQT
jgi:hypothetical protein